MRRAPFIALAPNGRVFTYGLDMRAEREAVLANLDTVQRGHDAPIRPTLAETIRDAAWAWVANENKRLTFVVTGCAVMLAVLIGQMAGV